MPFHFCIDELLAIMMLIPFIGIYCHRIHIWYHTKFGHKCHEKDCDDTHVVHSEQLPKLEVNTESVIESSYDDITACCGNVVEKHD